MGRAGRGESSWWNQCFDFRHRQCHKPPVKTAKLSAEKKTAGTLAVEQHRPLVNKLSDAGRRRLRARAAELLYGHEAAVPSR